VREGREADVREAEGGRSGEWEKRRVVREAEGESEG
jgi:hypothetical protein